MEEILEMKIDTFYEYMDESFEALSIACNLKEQDETDSGELDADFYRPNEYMISRLSRYGFLLSSMALESGANALIKKISSTNLMYEDYEKLPTLLKYETFCMYNGKMIDRGNTKYKKAKNIINCRNEFVHPKPREAKVLTNEKGDHLVSKKENRSNYPMYLNFIMLEHSLSAIGDIANFTSWILFDICKLKIKEGCLSLGLDTYSSTGAMDKIWYLKNFDRRVFAKTDG